MWSQESVEVTAERLSIGLECIGHSDGEMVIAKCSGHPCHLTYIPTSALQNPTLQDIGSALGPSEAHNTHSRPHWQGQPDQRACLLAEFVSCRLLWG